MKDKFLETCLCLLEEALIPSIKRHIRNTGSFKLSSAHMLQKLKKEAEIITKEELLELLLSDVSHKLIDSLCESLKAEDLHAVVHNSELLIYEEEQDQQDLFGNDLVSTKILETLKEEDLLLSEIIRKTKECENTVLKKLVQLIEDGFVTYKASDNEIFDTKLYSRV